MRSPSTPAHPRPALQMAVGLAVVLHLALGAALWLAPHARPTALATARAPASWTVLSLKPSATPPPGSAAARAHIAPPAHLAYPAPDLPPQAAPVPTQQALAPEPADQAIAAQVAEAPYYPRPELDVGPAPQGPILIDYPKGVATGTRQVGRLSLYIDEAGAVRNVAILPTDPPLPQAMQDAARNAFLQARFAPGQRQGAMVRSRIDIEVSFDDRPLDKMEAEAPKASPKALPQTSPETPPTSGA